MSASELYYRVPCLTFQTLAERSLSVTAVNGLVALDSAATRVLNTCSGVGTLEEHAALAWRTGAVSNPEALRRAMATLLESGLLKRADTTLAACGDPDAGTSLGEEITTVTVVTADRPDSLARCLRSAVAHVTEYQHSPRFIVVDGSRKWAEETKHVTIEASRRGPCRVEYVGREAAREVRERCRDGGRRLESMDAALTPGPIGSNRNLALLLTAGERVLMIDDDILCETWAPGDISPEICLSGHFDVRTWRFFESRDAAVAAAGRAPRDLIADHSRLLGAPLSRLLADSVAPDLHGACGHMLSSLEENRRSVVRVTMAGLAGDAARYCPHRLLFINGLLRELFRADPARLAEALRSREVHSIVSRPTVIHDPVCASYCMGVANDCLVPPFMPSGRGEDTVFGAMLACADPAALFAHLPCGVIHDSSRASEYGPDRMLSAKQTRISEFLMGVIAHDGAAARACSIVERMARCGRELTEIGGMHAKEFIAFVVASQLQARCAQVMALERALQRIPNCPIELVSAFEAYRLTFDRSAANLGFFLPLEFRGAPTLDEGFRSMQTFLREFGDLIQLWPDVWNEARLAAAR